MTFISHVENGSPTRSGQVPAPPLQWDALKDALKDR